MRLMTSFRSLLQASKSRSLKMNRHRSSAPYPLLTITEQGTAPSWSMSMECKHWKKLRLMQSNRKKVKTQPSSSKRSRKTDQSGLVSKTWVQAASHQSFRLWYISCIAVKVSLMQIKQSIIQNRPFKQTKWTCFWMMYSIAWLKKSLMRMWIYNSRWISIESAQLATSFWSMTRQLLLCLMTGTNFGIQRNMKRCRSKQERSLRKSCSRSCTFSSKKTQMNCLRNTSFRTLSNWIQGGSIFD